jgi:hypothetical protein
MLLALFVAGFAAGALLRRWALVLPLVIFVWVLSRPWHGVGIEVPPWYLALLLAGTTTAGVVVGVPLGRLVRRDRGSIRPPV